MRKFLLVPALFLLGLFLFSGKVSAQVSCPSSEMTCGEIDSRGGCSSPCLRVVTQTGGPAGRGAATPAQCQCQTPENQTGTVPLGQPCQQDSDCASPGRSCWGDFHQAPVCHELTHAETIQQSQTSQQTAATDNGPLGAGNCGEDELDTAIGCIPIQNTNEFIAFILRWAIGIGGGIAFLLIIYAAFMIMSSRGNPERLKAGQELLNSAIAGLILLIFSVFVLKVIGVDILKLPGFGQ